MFNIMDKYSDQFTIKIIVRYRTYKTFRFFKFIFASPLSICILLKFSTGVCIVIYDYRKYYINSILRT